jgi:hypothetical protein
LAITLIEQLEKHDYMSRGGIGCSVLQLDLGTYASDGVTFPKEFAGISDVWGVIPIANAGGYVYEYVRSTGKLKVYRQGGFTPAGTNGTSAVTGNVTVVGGGVGEAIGINPDSNAGVLSKAAATNRTIPIATLLGAAPTAGAQTFTGTAVAAAALTEVANGVDLSGVDPVFLVIGN